MLIDFHICISVILKETAQFVQNMTLVFCEKKQ